MQRHTRQVRNAAKIVNDIVRAGCMGPADWCDEGRKTGLNRS